MQDKKVYFYSLALALFFVGFNLYGMHKKTFSELFKQYDAVQEEKREQREEKRSNDDHERLMEEVDDVLRKATELLE